MNATKEPIPVLPLDYAKPSTDPRGRRWRVAARWSLTGAALVVAVGLILMVTWDTESVLATGPALFVAGATLLVVSIKLRLLLGAILGLAHCALPLLFTMLVNIRQWSPGEATLPFLVMGGSYLLGVTLPISALVFARTRAATLPNGDLPTAGAVAEDRA